jgi:hypothetical protein
LEIPDSYSRLLKDTGPTVLSVVAKDGSVQSSLVWSDYEEGILSINMLVDSPKYNSIIRSQKATLLKVDPDDEDIYISIRCSLINVEEHDAIAHLDRLTKRHMDNDNWYGGAMPNNDEEKLRRVVVYLQPNKIYFT